MGCQEGVQVADARIWIDDYWCMMVVRAEAHHGKNVRMAYAPQQSCLVQEF